MRARGDVLLAQEIDRLKRELEGKSKWIARVEAPADHRLANTKPLIAAPSRENWKSPKIGW